MPCASASRRPAVRCSRMTTRCSPVRRACSTTRRPIGCFELAEQWRIPAVLFTEGGGGRPGDTDFNGVAGLDVTTFHHWARLAGKLPRVGIVAGRCFAGNAALLGCSDVVIATQDSSKIGMGGPAMIEGGGLGVVAPDAVGPSAMQVGQRRDRHAGRRRGCGGARGEEVPVVLPGHACRMAVRRPAPAAPLRAREPDARLRHA